MKIDRRFTKLKKRSLLSFSTRILRNASSHSQVSYPGILLNNLKTCSGLLDELLQDIIIPRPKNLKEQIKFAEQSTMNALITIADYIEAQDLLKYDLYLSGFPLFTSKRKVA
jgi:hypothetical protein